MISLRVTSHAHVSGQKFTSTSSPATLRLFPHQQHPNHRQRTDTKQFINYPRVSIGISLAPQQPSQKYQTQDPPSQAHTQGFWYRRYSNARVHIPKTNCTIPSIQNSKQKAKHQAFHRRGRQTDRQTKPRKSQVPGNNSETPFPETDTCARPAAPPQVMIASPAGGRA